MRRCTSNPPMSGPDCRVCTGCRRRVSRSRLAQNGQFWCRSLRRPPDSPQATGASIPRASGSILTGARHLVRDESARSSAPVQDAVAVISSLDEFPDISGTSPPAATSSLPRAAATPRSSQSLATNTPISPSSRLRHQAPGRRVGPSPQAAVFGMVTSVSPVVTGPPKACEAVRLTARTAPRLQLLRGSSTSHNIRRAPVYGEASRSISQPTGWMNRYRSCWCGFCWGSGCARD
jgi:hypothetical protein